MGPKSTGPTRTHGDQHAAWICPLCGVDRNAVGSDRPRIRRNWLAVRPGIPAISDIDRVVICHGFACKFRTMIGFDASDHAELRKIMAKVGTAEAERAAMTKAVAWYGRRIAPEAGTARARARAAISDLGDPSQIDCVESSLNTTSILLILQDLGLLSLPPGRTLCVAHDVGLGAFDGGSHRP